MFDYGGSREGLGLGHGVHGGGRQHMAELAAWPETTKGRRNLAAALAPADGGAQGCKLPWSGSALRRRGGVVA